MAAGDFSGCEKQDYKIIAKIKKVEYSLAYIIMKNA